jgi:hypothetical protein
MASLCKERRRGLQWNVHYNCKQADIEPCIAHRQAILSKGKKEVQCDAHCNAKQATVQPCIKDNTTEKPLRKRMRPTCLESSMKIWAEE